MADQIQDWINKARQAGATDDEIRSKLRPEDIAKYFPTSTKSEDPGFFGELYKQNIEPFTQLFGRGQQAYQQGGVGGVAKAIPSTLLDILKSGVQTSGAYANQAIQDLQKGDYSSAAGHALGAVPLVGPQFAQAGENLTAGRTGAGLADLLSAAAAIRGSEAMKALGAPIRKLAPSVYEAGMNFPKGQKVPSPEEMTGLGLATKTPYAKDSAEAKMTGIVNDAMARAQSEVKKYGNLPIDTQKALKDLESEFQGWASTGDASEATPQKLLDVWERYVDQFGNSVDLQKAQDLKKGTWEKLNDKDFQKEAAQSPGLKQALFLRGTGLKSAIEDAVGGPTSPLAQSNQLAHTAMGLRSAFQSLDEASKPWFIKAIPWVAGVSGGALAGLGGMGYGSSALHYGMIASGAGLANYISRLAVQDPAVMTRLGILMNNVGKGNVAKFVSNLPKSSLLPDTQEQRENR